MSTFHRNIEGDDNDNFEGWSRRGLQDLRSAHASMRSGQC